MAVTPMDEMRAIFGIMPSANRAIFPTARCNRASRGWTRRHIERASGRGSRHPNFSHRTGVLNCPTSDTLLNQEKHKRQSSARPSGALAETSKGHKAC
jgi:hypothetical protein